VKKAGRAEKGTSLWRRSGALRWTVYLLLIFVVAPATLWVTLDTINRRNVERKLQALRDAGDPVTTAELAPAPVLDDQNAAILYQQIFRVDFDDPSRSKDCLLEATGHSGLIERQFVKDGSKATEARAVLNDPAVISIFETLEEGSRRPDCVFPVRWEDGVTVPRPYNLVQMPQAAEWLCAKVRLNIIDGDADEALRWIGVMFRMADHAAQDPTYQAQSVAIGIRKIGSAELERMLSRATPSAEATQDLLDYLRRLDVKERFDQAVRGERAMGIDTYALLRQPRPGYDWATESKGLLYCYRFKAFRPLYNADLSKYLTRMEEVLEQSAQVPSPPPQRPAPERRAPFGLDLHLTQGVDIFAEPSRRFNYRDSVTMRINMARVALAATLYKIGHGEYPATLNELQATLDWELPEDFFAGAPLKYQRRPDGFMLYSFGPDRDDDGGGERRASSRSYSNGDRMWECRAAPPPPAPSGGADREMEQWLVKMLEATP